jgi:hypothetical protein
MSGAGWAEKHCALNNFAPLDFELLELPEYQIQGTDRAIRENSASLYTSRGCPLGCTYCYNCSCCNCKWRGQSAEVVFGNLMRLYSSGIREIILCDEYFFMIFSVQRLFVKAVANLYPVLKNGGILLLLMKPHG